MTTPQRPGTAPAGGRGPRGEGGGSPRVVFFLTFSLAALLYAGVAAFTYAGADDGARRGAALTAILVMAASSALLMIIAAGCALTSRAPAQGARRLGLLFRLAALRLLVGLVVTVGVLWPDGVLPPFLLITLIGAGDLVTLQLARFSFATAAARSEEGS